MKGLTASSCGMLGYLCMFGKELKPHIASATFSWLYLTSAYLHNFSSACRYSFQLGPYQTTDLVASSPWTYGYRIYVPSATRTVLPQSPKELWR